jgi:heme A synthase
MSVILGGMSTLTASHAGSDLATRLERVRMASFGALTMLILQSVLGTAYNLYGTAPTATKSVGMFSSPLLAIHVVLGILLIIAAAVLVFRAAQARAGAGAVLAASIVGLLAILGAAGAGSSFANNGANGASLGMAIGTAVAMLCYAANLVIIGKRRG